MNVFSRILAILFFLAMAGYAAELRASSADMGAGPDADAEQLQTVLRASERAMGLQTELPGNGAGRKIQTTPPELPRPAVFSPDIARIILWSSLAVLLIVIALNLKDNLWSSSRSRRLSHTDTEELTPEATTLRMEQARTTADGLAGSMCFAEAMHVLLLQSVSELRSRLDVTIAASLTSREILRGMGLTPDEKAAFADIINRVEISYFGEHQPEAHEYLACRRSYEALAGALLLRREGA